MIAVAFTVSCRREEYLHRTLTSWLKVRGVRDVKLVFCLDAPAECSFPAGDFTSWTARSFPGSAVLVNDERKGCMGNTRHAMESAFATGADFAVLAEEDIEVASDTLEYFQWAREAYRDDPGILAVCSHVKSSQVRETASVVRVPWFNPLVWGTWEQRWHDIILPGWDKAALRSEAWDSHLRRVVRDQGKFAVYPVRSRARHIGETSTLVPAAFQEAWFRTALSSCFEPSYPPQEYRETSAERSDLGVVV